MRFNNSYGSSGGSANRLGAAFLVDFEADYRAHGAEVIARLRRDDVPLYLRLVMTLVPRQFDLEQLRSRVLDDVSDEELKEMIVILRQHMADQKAAEQAENGGESPAIAVDSALKNAIS